MINQEQAEAVARKVIDEPDPYWPDRPPHVITRVETHRLGWLFYYQSQEYIRTGNPSANVGWKWPDSGFGYRWFDVKLELLRHLRIASRGGT